MKIPETFDSMQSIRGLGFLLVADFKGRQTFNSVDESCEAWADPDASRALNDAIDDGRIFSTSIFNARRVGQLAETFYKPGNDVESGRAVGAWDAWAFKHIQSRMHHIAACTANQALHDAIDD